MHKGHDIQLCEVMLGCIMASYSQVIDLMCYGHAYTWPSCESTGNFGLLDASTELELFDIALLPRFVTSHINVLLQSSPIAQFEELRGRHDFLL